MNRHHWNNPHATRGKVLETKEPLHIFTGFWFEKINSIRNLKTKNMEKRSYYWWLVISDALGVPIIEPKILATIGEL